MEQLEFADHLGFDWISFSEHHYSYNSMAPHPAIMAARSRMRDRGASAGRSRMAHAGLPRGVHCRGHCGTIALKFRTRSQGS